MKLGNRLKTIVCQAVITVVMIAGCGNNKAPSVLPEEAMKTAMDAYIYGYPLVTFDMARQQETNVVRAGCRACADGTDDQNAKLSRGR